MTSLLSIPLASLSTSTELAATGDAAALPTPRPSSTRAALSVPRTYEVTACRLS